jgi:hypothetical protein
MMTQEEFMDVLALHCQGKAIKEIADEVGYHPALRLSSCAARGPQLVST